MRKFEFPHLWLMHWGPGPPLAEGGARIFGESAKNRENGQAAFSIARRMKSSRARIETGFLNTLKGGAAACFTRLRLWRSMSVWPDIKSHLANGKRRALSMQKVAPLPSGRPTSEMIT